MGVSGRDARALTGAGMGPSVYSPGAGWRLAYDGPGGEILGTVDLKASNTAIANTWLTLASGVVLEAGTTATITFTNNYPGSADSGNRFNIDAVRFLFTSPVPVQFSQWEVE